jgi:hypothetical protein
MSMRMECSARRSRMAAAIMESTGGCPWVPGVRRGIQAKRPAAVAARALTPPRTPGWRLSRGDAGIPARGHRLVSCCTMPQRLHRGRCVILSGGTGPQSDLKILILSLDPFSRADPGLFCRAAKLSHPSPLPHRPPHPRRHRCLRARSPPREGLVQQSSTTRRECLSELSFSERAFRAAAASTLSTTRSPRTLSWNAQEPLRLASSSHHPESAL